MRRLICEARQVIMYIESKVSMYIYIVANEEMLFLWRRSAERGGKNVKKRFVLFICISIFAAVVAGMYQRKNDSFEQMARTICNMEIALKDADEDWELEALSRITPYIYQARDGNALTYYCCKTVSMNEDATISDKLDTQALNQVVCIDKLENMQLCQVNSMPAVMGEWEGNTYLCWTLCAEYSFVIEYKTGTLAQEEIFRMAESVRKPQ